jgi:hypothetical protein
MLYRQLTIEHVGVQKNLAELLMTTENKQTLTFFGPDRVGLFLVDAKLFSNEPLAKFPKIFFGHRMTIQTRRLGTRL